MVTSRWLLALIIVCLLAGSVSPQVLLNIVGASQTRSNESTKVNYWLRGETEQWLTSDPLHRVSVIAWLNESYLRDHNANQSGVANHFVTEYDAVITRIGFLPYIVADVSSNMIGEIAQEQVIDVLFSAKYPEFQLSSDNILADVAADGNPAEFANTTLENSVASVDALRVWKMGYHGEGMKIAIVDTGINTSLPDGSPRPDLLFPNGTSKVLNNQMDFTDDGDTLDYVYDSPTVYGHGTWVAITAAGSGGQYYHSSEYGDITSAGVAPEASIINVKVFNKTGGVQVEWVTNGIDYAVEQGADVINLSLGHRDGNENDPYSEAADRAVSHGVMVVVAAGNEGLMGDGHLSSPGCAFNVTTVGSVGANNTASICDDVLDPNSSRGPTPDGRSKPEVVAPGVNQVYLDYVNNGSPKVVVISGTSFSTPHVSGVAALVRQAHPDWDPLMLRDALMKSARLNDYIRLRSENDRGKGIVSAYGAILNATPADFSVSSIVPVVPHYSVFQVYQGGMWVGYQNGSGQPITMNYIVTVRREGAYGKNPFLMLATCGIKRINNNVPGDESIISETQTWFELQDEIAHVFVWNETDTMEPGNWTICGFVDVGLSIGSQYYDGWPDDNVKNDGATEAKEIVSDINGDSLVDIYDALKLSGSFNSISGEKQYNVLADLNKDGIIDIFDALIMSGQFNWRIDCRQTGGVLGRPWSGSSVNVLMSGATYVTIDPTTIVVFKGDIFSVNVKIDDVVALQGWQFQMYWNKTLLNCTGVAVHTPVEWQNSTQDYGPGLELNYNSTHARFLRAQSASYPAPSFNGSMVIATFTFQAMQSGTDYFVLEYVKLGNSTAEPIDCTVSDGSVTVYYGRYMRSDTQQVNGLTAYKLNIPQSTSSAVNTQSGSGMGASWGIRAWVRHSNGVEQEVRLDGQSGTPTATVGGGSAGIRSDTVSVAQTALQSTDSLVIRVYLQIADEPWNLCGTFTTEQLQSSTLKATTWTVYYYTFSVYNRMTDRTTAKFHWGTTTYNSRLQNVQFT